MIRLFNLAPAVSALTLSAGAAYAGSTQSSGDLVKAISEDRARQEGGVLQTGRASAGGQDGPAIEHGAPSDGREKEHNMLQGVDPAVTY